MQCCVGGAGTREGRGFGCTGTQTSGVASSALARPHQKLLYQVRRVVSRLVSLTSSPNSNPAPPLCFTGKLSPGKMPHSFGYRAATRTLFKKPFKTNGRCPTTTYLRTFKVRRLAFREPHFLLQLANSLKTKTLPPPHGPRPPPPKNI